MAQGLWVKAADVGMCRAGTECSKGSNGLHTTPRFLQVTTTARWEQYAVVVLVIALSRVVIKQMSRSACNRGSVSGAQLRDAASCSRVSQPASRNRLKTKSSFISSSEVVEG